jgi:hypothetical protein
VRRLPTDVEDRFGEEVNDQESRLLYGASADHKHRSPSAHDEHETTQHSAPVTCASILRSLAVTFRLLFTSRNLQLIIVTTFYSGVVLTFWQGKYGEIVSGKDESLHLPSEFKPRLISFVMIIIGVGLFDH